MTKMGRNHICRKHLFTTGPNMLCEKSSEIEIDLIKKKKKKKLFLKRYFLINMYPQHLCKYQFTKDHLGKKLTFLFI